VRPTCIIGIAKAAVFPLPVSAQPKRSRPERAIGMAWAWMGVGLVYEWKVMSFMMLEFSPCASSQKFSSGGVLSYVAVSPTRNASQCDKLHTVRVQFLSRYCCSESLMAPEKSRESEADTQWVSSLKAARPIVFQHIIRLMRCTSLGPLSIKRTRASSDLVQKTGLTMSPKDSTAVGAAGVPSVT
jgi:hypothetical protein